jgi:hypothetical protein
MPWVSHPASRCQRDNPHVGVWQLAVFTMTGKSSWISIACAKWLIAKCFSNPSSLRPGGTNMIPALHLSLGIYQLSEFSEIAALLRVELGGNMMIYIRMSRRSCKNSVAHACLTEANDSMSIFMNVIPTEGLAFWTSAMSDFAASEFRPLK